MSDTQYTADELRAQAGEMDVLAHRADDKRNVDLSTRNRANKYKRAASMLRAGADAMDALANSIPRLENCGKFIAKNNKGEWFYLNHANAWQQFQGYDEAQGVVSLLQSQTLRDLEAAQARVKVLEEALLKLANASDAVGVRYFDGDNECDKVDEMITATIEARAALGESK